MTSYFAHDVLAQVINERRPETADIRFNETRCIYTEKFRLSRSNIKIFSNIRRWLRYLLRFLNRLIWISEKHFALMFEKSVLINHRYLVEYYPLLIIEGFQEWKIYWIYNYKQHQSSVMVGVMKFVSFT